LLFYFTIKDNEFEQLNKPYYVKGYSN
jgi:hypothetical protein